MRGILAAIAGVFMAMIGVIIFFLLGSEDRNEIATVAPTPEVVAERQAPATRNDPMQPVTEAEAARRAELHQRIANPEALRSAAVMAPSVVTEVVAANADDELSRELFGDVLSTPEPQRELPMQDILTTVIQSTEDKFNELVDGIEVPEEPVEEVVEVVEEPEPAPRLNPYQFRDRFRVDTSRPGNNFGVHTMDGMYEGAMDDGAFLSPEVIRELLGDDYLQLAGFEEEEGWFEPYQVADGTGGFGLTDPIVRPQYDFQTQSITGYGAPLANERSAARPAMSGTDAFGQPFTTSDRPNPVLAARNGPIVLARSGDIIMARLLYGFNSDDVRGLPIYAVISDFLPNGAVGPLNGARIQGQVAYSQNNAAIIFDSIVLENGREFDIGAIAVSAENGRTGVADRVNRHVLARYGSLFLAGIIQGVGEVAQIRLADDNNGDTIIINEGGGTVNVDNDEPSDGEILAGALAPVGRQLSSAAARGFNRPPTISAPAGMPFALVFTSTVVSDPATARTAFNPRTGQVEVVGSVNPTPAPQVAVGATSGPTPVLSIPESGDDFRPLGEGQNGQ